MIKKKWITKIASLALLGATLVSSGLGLASGATPAEAATVPDKVTVEINKLKKGAGADITNTGEAQTITGHEAFPDSGGEISFTLIDATTWFYLKANNKFPNQVTTTQVNSLIDQLAALADNHKTGTNGAYNAGSFTSAVGGLSVVGTQSISGGKTSFANVTGKDASGNSRFYIALETKKPSSVTNLSVPLVFALPMTNVAGKDYLSKVVLYAKNEVSSATHTILKKTGKALDGTTKNLANVEFDLYKGTPGSTSPAPTKVNSSVIKTDTNGEIKMDVSMAHGDYFFVETKVADPYLLSPLAQNNTANEMRFRVDNSGFSLLDTAGAVKAGTQLSLVDNEKPGGKKESNEAGKAKEIGTLVTYTATIDVPHDIADWKSEPGKLANLKYIDKPTSGLTYERQTLTVMDGATKLTVGTDFHFEYQGTKDVNEGFYINLFDDTTGKVINSALAGKKLTLTYQMKVTKDAVVESAVKNNWEIKYNNGAENDTNKNIPNKPVTVTTGGFKFKKVGDDGATGLKDAKFIISQGTKYFAGYKADDNVTPTWTTTKGDAYVFTTISTGLFEVKGFAEGAYKLEEIEAPKDYQLPTTPVNFTIVAPTFDANGTMTAPGSYGDPAKLLTIKNNKKSKLPVTGGMGTIIFAVAGLAVLSGAFVFYRKKIA